MQINCMAYSKPFAHVTYSSEKDISDPDVVKDFAEKLGDMEHLDYLYTLTVADINATNPKLWNTWRASLMRQLYTHARDVIRTGLGRPVDYQMLIEDTKFAASELLVNNFALADVEKYGKNLVMNTSLKSRQMKLHGIHKQF